MVERELCRDGEERADADARAPARASRAGRQAQRTARSARRARSGRCPSRAQRLRSGKPWIAVSATFAWISAPDMTSFPEPAVAWTSCSDGADGPITTSLSAKRRRRHLPVHHARVRVRLDRPGRPDEVDPGLRRRRLLRSAWPRYATCGRDDAEARRAPGSSHGTWRMTPSESAGRIALPAPRAELLQHVVAAEDGRVAVVVHLGRREHDVSGPADGLDQLVVARGARARLGELDVDRDRPRCPACDPVDHASRGSSAGTATAQPCPCSGQSYVEAAGR